MYQSSSRKNFLDTFTDPTAIAILGSIALHAAVGATFPFLTQPEKEGKKAGPTTVKVVELTAGELQRIPQVPKPKPVSPPVTQPIPVKQKTAPPPRTPQFSNSPQGIPFSPFGSPAATATPKKPAKNKQQQPLQQPAQPVFDPNIFTEPKPTKSPVAKAATPKPVVKLTPTAKPKPKQPKVATSPSPQLDQPMDWNGDGQEPGKPIAPSQAQKPAPTTPSATPAPSTTPPATTPAPSTSTGDGSAGNGFYGKYTDAAIKQLQVYMKEFGVTNPYPSRAIVRSYPQGTLCGKEKQTPFIVMMAVFDKIPDNPDAAILGNSSAPSLKISTFKDRDTPAQQKLAEIATRAALEEANKADQNRPEKDKGQRVIYQYRVEFDPATCKKN